MTFRTLIVPFAVASAFAAPAFADNWTANITVDNQYDIYFGTPTTTNFYAGGDTDWTTTETWTATGRPSTDYLYVATASDHSVAQGFLGEFTNTTQSITFRTGSPFWDVFAAGPWLNTLYGMGGSWPAGTQPTQAQVDTAINFATTNNLWQTPDTYLDWDNRASGNITTWGTRPGIANSAEWIWHIGSGLPPTTNPFSPGADHDEFLIFRVASVPAPGAAILLILGALPATRRRR